MSQYRDSMDSAKSRLNEGMDSAKSAAYDAKDYVSSKLHDARDQVDHMTEDMRERFNSLRETDYDEVWDGIKDRVRENPGPALLLAGAVGLALGVLFIGSSAATRRR